MINYFLGGLAMIAIIGSASIAANDAMPQQIDVGLGWAKSSINTVIFRHSSIVSSGDTQFISYYDGDSKVVVAKRKLGDTHWDIVTTALTGNTKDAHNTISLGLDGNGFLHLSWDHHGADLNYVKSKEPFSLDLTGKLTTDGVQETGVTYPEFYSMPNGDLLLLYRVGRSGRGDLVLKRYAVATSTWTTVQPVLISGQGKENAYWEMCVDARGTIHMAWVWRRTPDVETNHDICYAKSEDGGVTWMTSTGQPQALPISSSNCQTVYKIPEKSDLINQTSIAADSDGHPYIATYYRPKGMSAPQFMVVYNDGKGWNSSQVGSRKTDFSLAGAGTKRVPISRPLLVVDDRQTPVKIHVVFRDEERGNCVTMASSDGITSGDWKFQDLTTQSVGSWEPTCDLMLWTKQKVLDLFLQKNDQLDGGDGANRTNGPAPTMVSVLEVKP
jgi:hypothetical protein